MLVDVAVGDRCRVALDGVEVKYPIRAMSGNPGYVVCYRVDNAGQVIVNEALGELERELLVGNVIITGFYNRFWESFLNYHFQSLSWSMTVFDDSIKWNDSWGADGWNSIDWNVVRNKVISSPKTSWGKE